MVSSNESSYSQQYLELIEQIIANTLQGKIRSKNQVSQTLLKNIASGTGETFERCLLQQIDDVTEQLKNTQDELKQAKASRRLRALETIKSAWLELQAQKQETEIYQQAAQQIIAAAPGDRLTTLIQILDLNRDAKYINIQLPQLAQLLAQNPETKPYGDGISKGLEATASLEDHLISWMYQQSNQLGFEKTAQQGPWGLWSKKVKSIFNQQLFTLQAENKSALELAYSYPESDGTVLVETAVLFRGLQQRLLTWFDQQPYSVKFGKRLSSVTLLIFAAIWSELSNGFKNAVTLNTSNRDTLSEAAFQVMLQILRTFAKRPDFPLYGGIFASFSGASLRNVFAYFDQPLQQLGETQEKGRILTLLGYSQRTLGRSDNAIKFHQEALEIANNTGDFLGAIANLNHLSRTYIAEKDYQKAISYAQRGLIIAREKGDRLGEANAMVNLNYSEVLNAQQTEEMSPEIYERCIENLQRALTIAQKLDDAYGHEIVKQQTQALACNSLGIAYLILEKPLTAIEYLTQGLQAANLVGDEYLYGLNLIYLGEAYYQLKNLVQAVTYGCLAMYVLKRIHAQQWRQAAGLVSILESQMGGEAFDKALSQNRSQIIAAIGVDGFDYLKPLLEEYRR